MNAVTHRVNVRGQKVVCRTSRRYLVIGVRAHNVPSERPEGGVFIAFAHVLKRTDSLDVAFKMQAAYPAYKGAQAIVYDTATRQEVV